MVPECDMKVRFCFVVIPVFGLLVGCGQSLAPVKGRVTCNGKPVAEAQITFNPVGKDATDKEAGKPGTGFTDAEGNFVLSTYRPRWRPDRQPSRHRHAGRDQPRPLHPAEEPHA
jgi:hypothetical protein